MIKRLNNQLYLANKVTLDGICQVQPSPICICHMVNLPLDPDDLPPTQLSQSDRVLCRQLEESISRHFYESCNGVTQALLLSCEWYITTNTQSLMLVVTCPDMMTNWRVLNNIVAIGNILEQFISTARIRICPPADTGVPFEIRVDEISVYRDSL